MPKSVSRKARMEQGLSSRDARAGDEAAVQAVVRSVLGEYGLAAEGIALYRSFGFKPFARAHLACRCDQAMAPEL